MGANVTIPSWVIVLAVSLLVTIIGAIMAHVRAFTKLSSAVEHLSAGMSEVNKNISSLSGSVGELNKVVALLAKDVERIDAIDNDVRKIKSNLHIT
jgi:uncharacterized protein YoxC